MTLSVTHYGVTISVSEDHDDQTFEQMLGHVKTLLLAMGYPPKTVEDEFGDV